MLFLVVNVLVVKFCLNSFLSTLWCNTLYLIVFQSFVVHFRVLWSLKPALTAAFSGHSSRRLRGPLRGGGVPAPARCGARDDAAPAGLQRRQHAGAAAPVLQGRPRRAPEDRGGLPRAICLGFTLSSLRVLYENVEQYI